MLKEVKFRIFSVKCIIVLSGLLLIAVCAYAQSPVWQWATNVGGTDWDFGNGIATDNGGNVYITGNFQGTAAFGPYFLTSTGETDIYMAKLDINRNWVWIQKAGGFDNDSGSDIVIDRSNNIYITG
ncbi:MAG: SBBP repeat-containing protein, partial [Candidatus Cloacimonetes bacterium]|nr:SBBP repeat-containing protein [Candidatus Cloacimonadota bacterium]